MSHKKERKEKNCLNCNAEVMGKYCQICGQENIEPKETFWLLVTHFVYDLTHFDGKFFSTIRQLLLRPGFLSHEYMRGRRTSYLNPLRMYIFTSAFFFVFFFTIIPTESLINIDSDNKKGTTYQLVKNDLLKEKGALEKSVAKPNLSSNNKAELENELAQVNADLAQIDADTANLNNLLSRNSNFVIFGEKKYVSIKKYDSIQNQLPANKKDNWLERKLVKKSIGINTEYKNDGKRFITDLFEKFLHSFPQILFISLPLFALLLRLLYIRHKKFYYADHIIFTVHLYCAMFIIIFLQISISKLSVLSNMPWVKIFELPLVFYIGWYIYKAIKYFYNQGKGKTTGKVFLLLFLSFFVMTFLFTFFIMFSVFTL